MKSFLFLYRHDPKVLAARSPAEMEAEMKKWMDWLGGIAAQNKLVDKGNRLNDGGKVVKAKGIVTDGPYMEIKEAIGGYSMVKADSAEEAAEMAKGCPILGVNGTVEVREVDLM